MQRLSRKSGDRRLHHSRPNEHTSGVEAGFCGMETAKFRPNFHKSIVNRAERVQFFIMKAKKKAAIPRTWYEQIWDKIELVNTNPELASYLDVDKLPEYQINVTAKLIGQGLPLTPPKELKIITPEKLGRVLGQQCATFYELGKQFEPLGNPETVKQTEKTVELLTKNEQLPGVGSLLQAANVAGMLVLELAKHFPKFEKNVHAAFKAALNQHSHQEVIEFFRGYAHGLANPGMKDGKLRRRTDATTLQLKMFVHAEQIAKMKTVNELRAFLLKNGFTEQILGNDERLQKFCSRLGFAPGKHKSKEKQ